MLSKLLGRRRHRDRTGPPSAASTRGGWTAYLDPIVYRRSVRGVDASDPTPSTFFVLDADKFGNAMRRVGVSNGGSSTRRCFQGRQEERTQQDHRSARATPCTGDDHCRPGLTHELNNPASAHAGSVATASLRDRVVAGMRHKLGMVASTATSRPRCPASCWSCDFKRKLPSRLSPKASSRTLSSPRRPRIERIQLGPNGSRIIRIREGCVDLPVRPSCEAGLDTDLARERVAAVRRGRRVRRASLKSAIRLVELHHRDPNY